MASLERSCDQKQQELSASESQVAELTVKVAGLEDTTRRVSTALQDSESKIEEMVRALTALCVRRCDVILPVRDRTPQSVLGCFTVAATSRDSRRRRRRRRHRCRHRHRDCRRALLQTTSSNESSRVQSRRIAELESDLAVCTKRLRTEEAASEVVTRRMQDRLNGAETDAAAARREAMDARERMETYRAEIDRCRDEARRVADARADLEVQVALMEESKAAVERQRLRLEVRRCRCR